MIVARLALASALWAASSLALADQPAMEAALASLQSARASLERATVDKGGHRVKALQAVDRAIAEVKAGIAFDRRHTGPNENRK